MDEETLAVFERLIEAVNEVNASIEQMEESIIQSIEGGVDAIIEKLDSIEDTNPPEPGDLMDLGKREPWDHED